MGCAVKRTIIGAWVETNWTDVNGGRRGCIRGKDTYCARPSGFWNLPYPVSSWNSPCSGLVIKLSSTLGAACQPPSPSPITTFLVSSTKNPYQLLSRLVSFKPQIVYDSVEKDLVAGCDFNLIGVMTLGAGTNTLVGNENSNYYCLPLNLSLDLRSPI